MKQQNKGTLGFDQQERYKTPETTKSKCDYIVILSDI